MAGPLLRRIPALIEAHPEEHDAAGQSAGAPRRRLSPFGQCLLAAAVLLAGTLVYTGAWELSRRMSSRGEICLKLPAPQTVQQAPPGGNQLLRQYRIGMELIGTLSTASAGQKLRLGEQLSDLVRELDSLCRLSYYYTDQAAALLTLATGSATLIVVCLVLMAPQGLQNVSRGLRAVLFAAAALLGLAVNFLQLGEQQVNDTQLRQSYRGHDALLQRLSSSLANQRLEQGLSPGDVAEPLTSTEAVARLISGVDHQRLAMPDPRLRLNDALAQATWTRLLGSGTEPPAGTGREAGAAAGQDGQR